MNHLNPMLSRQAFTQKKRLDHWLALIRRDIPELAAEIDAYQAAPQ